MSSLNAIKPACVRETDHLVKTKNHTRLRVSDIRYHLIQTDHPRQTKVCSAASTNVNHHVPKEWLDKSMMDGSCSLDYHRLMSSLSRKELWVRKIDGKIDRSAIVGRALAFLSHRLTLSLIPFLNGT